MTDELLGYERDPRAVEREVVPRDAGIDAEGAWALLDDTILYPGGGGQPPDRGWLGEVEVTAVERRQEGLRHRLAAPLPSGIVRLRVDWSRRFDHMQQHTGQHLLTAIAADRFGWRTTSFHLGAAVCDIELAVPQLAPEELVRLEEAVAAEVRAARRVTARRVPLADLERLGARSRGLPEGFSGDARLVEIEGIDLAACGGTHLASTAEIESLALLGTEPMRGGTRLFWVAGGRVRRRLAEHERRAADLRRLLGAPEEGLVAAAAEKAAALEALGRELRSVEERFETQLAEALALRPGVLIDEAVVAPLAGGAARLAQRVASRRPEALVFVTAPLGAGFAFALVAGERCDLPLAELGRGVAAVLGGRGGGSGRSFQGKVSTLAGREQVVSTLRAALDAPGGPL
ncbi:MAG: alanyl-tRNA editing protein [Holophagales bacterium]|nr:MAG: alanyl-tRNA editing protein [Holophagales bacterium]